MGIKSWQHQDGRDFVRFVRTHVAMNRDLLELLLAILIGLARDITRVHKGQ